MLPPQNENDCLDLINAMEAHYADAMRSFEEDAMFYEGQIEQFIEVPEGFEVTIPTTPRAVVDEAVDNATPQDILVHYAPRARGKRYEEDADKVRSFIKAVWRYWRSRGSDIDPVRDFLKNLFMSGKAIFKVAPDWSLWPSLDPREEDELRRQGGRALIERVRLIEEVRQQNFPLFIRSIAPQCIMEDPTLGARKLWVIERYQTTPAEVRNYYSRDVPEFRDYYSVSVPVHELWTASYVGFNGEFVQGKRWLFVNYELVDVVDNHHHELPYIIKYSGFGREAYDGRPELKSVGFFTRHNKSMFLAEARRLTQIDAIMQEVAFPVAFLPDTVDSEQVDFSPGFVNYVPQEVMEYADRIWLTPRIPSGDYMTSLSVIRDQIERGTVQRALRGAGLPGTDSAAQYNTIASQAKLRIESARTATVQAMAWASEQVLKWIDNDLNDRVSLYVAEKDAGEYRIGPENIGGHYRVAIEFQPNEDAVKERRLVLASDAIARGGLSRWDAYTFAGFDNPWELIERKMADDLMQEPLIRRALAKRVLKEWGEDADQLELQERIDQAENQLAIARVAQELQIGTPRGGDPMAASGNPAEALPIPAALQTPGALQALGMQPMGAGPAPAPPGPGGLVGVQPGAPAGVEAGPVAGLLRDLSALRSQPGA